MNANIQTSIPVLLVSDAASAKLFYCEKLGFKKQWEYKPSAPEVSPAYLGLERDGAQIHISSFCGDGNLSGVVFFFVGNVDALFREFSVRDVKFELEPFNQTWGNREMYLRDPDGNSLRFGQLLEPTA